MGKCRWCKQPIDWQKTKNGAWMPCNPKAVYFVPDSNGRVLVLNSLGEIVTAHLGDDAADGITRIGYIPHFATCMKSKENRSRLTDAERQAKQRAKARRQEERMYRKIEKIEEAWKKEKVKKDQLSFFEDTPFRSALILKDIYKGE